MHRSPVEYAQLSRREIASIWACMEIAIEESKRQAQEAKRKSRRR